MISINAGLRRRHLLAASSASLALPSLTRATSVTTLRFIPQIDLAFLDPHWTTANVTRGHGYMVFDTLYGQDGTYTPRPQMLEGHVVDNDGKLWKLTLRDGLLWHDGQPVLARDCVASIKRWAKRDAFGGALMAATDELSAPNDKTIQFRLHKPFPLLPNALSKPTTPSPVMMPERLANTDPFKQITEMVGSGPFRFVADERVSGATNVYARFDRYKPRENDTPD
jgi:peptide/nickel transport system substrate-binding protein